MIDGVLVMLLILHDHRLAEMIGRQRPQKLGPLGELPGVVVRGGQLQLETGVILAEKVLLHVEEGEKVLGSAFVESGRLEHLQNLGLIFFEELVDGCALDTLDDHDKLINIILGRFSSLFNFFVFLTFLGFLKSF